MRTVSSLDAKNSFGQLLDPAQRAPVTVTRKGRPAAVVMSIEDYERMHFCVTMLHSMPASPEDAAPTRR